MIKKLSVLLTLAAFLISCVNPLYADSLFPNLPSPGIPVQTSPAFKPVMLQGVQLDPKNPLHLDFIVNTGDAPLDAQTLRMETTKLVRYFLASLTVPNDQLWVNLSPYEKNRIIPDGLSLTEMGSELLAQDYMLKQLTASLMGPEQAAGKQFWSQIYAKANEKYGSTQIPLDIFNKVWIVPDTATIYEHQGTAVIVQSHLKVMLEEDYLAMAKHAGQPGDMFQRTAKRCPQAGCQASEALNVKATQRIKLAQNVIRRIILPIIEKEVNEGRNFAGVRQVNNALILAAWFKQNLKESLLGQKYANRNKVSGIDLQDRRAKQEIYEQYLKAFKKGVYNYIKEDIDPQTQAVVARKYFLGGYNGGELKLSVREATAAQVSESVDGLGDRAMLASFDLDAILNQQEASKISVEERLAQIQESNYQGFPVVHEDKDIPTGIQYTLFYYDLIEGEDNNPLRAMIREGRLRAGPDNQQIIHAVKIENTENPEKPTILVSTDTENRVDEELINLISGSEIAAKESKWKGGYRSDLKALSLQTAGVIAKPVEVLGRYGIFDLFKDGQGGFRTITMRDIVEHVESLKPDGEKIKFNTPNRQYIHGVLRALHSLGWLKRNGKSASDDMQFTLTPKGQIAVQYVDLYAQVADFVPEFSTVIDYLYNRPNRPAIKRGTLKGSVELAQRGWDIPASVDPGTAEQISANLNGYLVGNLALSLYLDKGAIEKNQVEEAGFVWDDVYKQLIQNHLVQIKRSSSTKIVLITNWEQEKDKILKMFGDNFLPLLVQAGGVFDLFDSKSIIDLQDVIKLKNIKGNTDELKAAFDLFAQVGYLTDLGNGRYKKTAEGLIAFDRVLAYGVPFSYRPSYDLSEQFLFGDAKAIKRRDENGRELLVYRYLNVLGSGASHATYFKQVDQIIENMMKERLMNGEILSPDALSAEYPFVLAIADTGSGDGTFLAHIYHVIVHNTVYGRLMRQFPDLYKLEMIGIDFNEEAQNETSDNLASQDIEHITMFGDIGDPFKIVHDVDQKLDEEFASKGIKNIHKMVIHTRTFLDHNRPWKDVLDKIAAANRHSTSTGAYGWQGEALSNDLVEQNLLEHFQAWAQALASVGQKDLINIELHTIDPDIAAESIGTTLDVPYYLSHMFSDQFIIELPIYQEILKEAGFHFDDNPINHRISPPRNPQKATVSVDYLMMNGKSAEATDHAMLEKPVGGINLNPDLGFIHVEKDAEGQALPLEINALQNINIDGIQPILLKIVPLNDRFRLQVR